MALIDINVLSARVDTLQTKVDNIERIMKKMLWVLQTNSSADSITRLVADLAKEVIQ